MNINKKFDRLRRWGDEKMGAQKSTYDDEFQALAQDMNTRQKGIERLHGSVSTYVRGLQEKKQHPETKEKLSPIGNIASVMVHHGQDFDDQSKFGQCLISYGRANERIARVQDSYAANLSSSWLEPLDRNLAQMKEYQKGKKQLEARRLAYDTSLNKVQRNKKDDYRLDEELRAQKAKYEESQEDVMRRMQDITETESDTAGHLYNLLEAELEYFERCREILLQLKRDWPAGIDNSAIQPRPPMPSRSRTSTLSRAPTTTTIDEDSALNDDYERPALPSRRMSRNSSAAASPMAEAPGFNFPISPNTGMVRTPLSVAGRSNSDVTAPVGGRPVLSRNGTDSSIYRIALRPVSARKPSASTQRDVFADTADLVQDDVLGSATPDRRSSGASSSDMLSRNTSWSTLDQSTTTSLNKKAPPPPPPRRDSKPGSRFAPPAPPAKRLSLMNTVQ